MERAELEQIAAETGLAEKHGGYVFLCDPQWTLAQRAAFDALSQSAVRNSKSEVSTGWLCLATGGTGGALKFARHDERTLGAAVTGFCRHFGLQPVNAVGVLPLHHVSGFMALLRCRATGGSYLPWDWRKLEAGHRPPIRGGSWTLSLVPTQLQRLLRSRAATAWLRRFELVLIGGGPVWPDLAAAAARAKLRIVLSYGMTETAAMITAQTPEEFLAGDRSSGRVLPHGRVRLGRGGVIRVGGRSLFRGYVGSTARPREHATGDLGAFDPAGRLRVLGRHDDVIITGGKKVQPALVEAALRATGRFSDVAVVGLPHPEWGEEVVACHPPGRKISLAGLRLEALTAYQRPKRLLTLPAWPRNAQGKLNRPAVRALALTLTHPRGERGRQRHAFPEAG
ncbi:MAG: AMP-binding protein [Opitutaceae bacterium]|nr:AMP-binding protein [Opitutaceae bacterium]